MKYFIVAGEASGDLHASNLMQGIIAADPQADFRYYGGDLMAARGGTLLKHYRGMAFMGFVEVVRNIRTILATLRQCKSQMASYNPDAVILVDYPGFNLRMARFASRKGFRVFYYIAPKVWAWNEGRVRRIRAHVDRLFVIFPFEVEYFRRHGIEAIYEGNPLADAIAGGPTPRPAPEQFVAEHALPGIPIVTLMPGSRPSEVAYNLPVMLTLVNNFPSYQFVIAGAPAISPEFYHKHIGIQPVAVVHGHTYSLLRSSILAIVTSGTATLEAALLHVPQVVCYRNNVFTMLIAWALIRVQHISLVNLIMRREVVKELVQLDLTPARLLDETLRILPGQPARQAMLNDYKRLHQLLGSPGASYRVGRRMVELLSKPNT